MKKFKKISLAMGVAMAMAMTNVVLADNKGDSLVYLPKNNMTIQDDAGDNTDVADVWFVKDSTALAYSITLVNLADASCAIGVGAALGDDTLILESSLLMANTLSCDDESQLTKTGGDAPLATAATPVKLCNWTSNVLAVGNYALAINPIHVGDATASSPEALNAITSCGNDSNVHINNVAVDFNMASDGHFQLFTVEAPTAASVISQAPDAPVLVGPSPTTDEIVAGATVAEFIDGSTGNGIFTFDDVSPDEGEATWYKIYIQHPDGSRVTVNGDNWFKLLVDTQLTCTATVPAATGQKRTCEIDLTENEVTGDLDDSTLQPGLEYTYWIRGYNGDSGGATGPWSAAGKFKHEIENAE